MTSRFFCLLWLLAVSLSARSPNVVVILADDLGYGDLSSHGAKEMQTPHIDRLMSQGMRFSQFYANCTVCSPTRASFMTGRYPDLVGVPGVIRQRASSSWGHFRPSGPTLPELLGKGGYHTALIGKWHLGLASPNLPNERGFDLFHGFLGDMMNDYYTHRRGGVNWMRRNREVIDPEGHATEIFSDWAIDYLRRRKSQPDQPFFLYLAYNAPHFPIQPPEAWLEKVRQREPQLGRGRAANVAFVEHLDHEVGRVLETLDSLDLSRETVVVFTSDNGGSLRHAQSNGELNGGKGDHWEGGIRVPTCVVWPGHVEAGSRSAAPGMTMDLLPTLCELAGVPVNHEIDGQSLADVWREGAPGEPDRTMVWVRREGGDLHQGRAYYAIRRGSLKLLQNHAFEPMQVVDLERDPLEQAPRPVQGKPARELATDLAQHILESGAVPWQAADE